MASLFNAALCAEFKSSKHFRETFECFNLEACPTSTDRVIIIKSISLFYKCCNAVLVLFWGLVYIIFSTFSDILNVAINLINRTLKVLKVCLAQIFQSDDEPTRNEQTTACHEQCNFNTIFDRNGF